MPRGIYKRRKVQPQKPTKIEDKKPKVDHEFLDGLYGDLIAVQGLLCKESDEMIFGAKRLLEATIGKLEGVIG